MMGREPQQSLTPVGTSADAPAESTLTPEQLADLSNSEKQAEYRREYLAQLRRQACPGCGEDFTVF